MKSVIQAPATPSALDNPIEVTGISREKLHEYVGRRVTVRGKFSLYGVIGPFIRNGDWTVYFRPNGNYSWGKEYDPMEAHEVTATGILHFRHFEPSPDQHPPDYYFFQAETAPISLVK
jgi:hypothetical protein